MSQELRVIASVQNQRQPIQYQRLYKGHVSGPVLVGRSGRAYYMVQPDEPIEGVRGWLPLMTARTVVFTPKEWVPMITGRPAWPGVDTWVAPVHLADGEQVLFTLVPNKHKQDRSKWFIECGGSLESYKHACAFYAVNPDAPAGVQEMAGFRFVCLERYTQKRWEPELQWKDYDELSRFGLVNRLINRRIVLPQGCTIKSWWEDDSKPLGARVYVGNEYGNILYNAKLMSEKGDKTSTVLTFDLLEHQVLTEQDWVSKASTITS